MQNLLFHPYCQLELPGVCGTISVAISYIEIQFSVLNALKISFLEMRSKRKLFLG